MNLFNGDILELFHCCKIGRYRHIVSVYLGFDPREFLRKITYFLSLARSKEMIFGCLACTKRIFER